MSEDKPFEDKSYPLDVLKRLLDTPQLLPHEDSKEFHQLFDSLEVYGKAQTARDYMAVYQATVLTWDILRLHEMKIGVLRSHQRAGTGIHAAQEQCGSGAKGRRADNEGGGRSESHEMVRGPCHQTGDDEGV